MHIKNTKIVCTLGPSSDSVTEIKNLIQAGMNVARLNFSHGSYESHKGIIQNVHKVEKMLGRRIGIMQDLQGPKIRLSDLKEPITAKRGDKVVLPLQQKSIAKQIKKGHKVFVNDGLIELKVEKSLDGKLYCKVVTGGILKSRMGVNIPDTKISNPSLTEKDKKDLKFGLQQGVDLVALSFVRSAKDIRDLRNLINKHGKSTPIMAKIERSEAIENIEEIIKAADSIMIARGDMGVNLPPEIVPIVQKRIIHLANRYGKPVVVATQVLTSMITNPIATRAEISDAANAVFDHADAILLSNETVIGKYPARATATLSRVASVVENELKKHKELLDSIVSSRKYSPLDAYCMNACEMAMEEEADMIAVYTESGYTAQQIAKYRIYTPIIVITPHEKTARELTLVWGLNKVFVKTLPYGSRSKSILQFLQKEKLTKKKSKVIILCCASKKSERTISSFET